MSKGLILLLFFNVTIFCGQTKQVKIFNDKKMGTFGLSNFDNDDALDWLNFFLQQPSVENIDLTLTKVLNNNNYIEVDDCNQSIVASEILAALNGRISPNYPEEAKKAKITIEITDLIKLKKKAVNCLMKIRTNSELKELYMDNKDYYYQWLLNIDELIKRLKE